MPKLSLSQKPRRRPPISRLSDTVLAAGFLYVDMLKCCLKMDVLTLICRE